MLGGFISVRPALKRIIVSSESCEGNNGRCEHQTRLCHRRKSPHQDINLLRLPDMRDITAGKALGAVKACEGVLLLLALEEGNVMPIHCVKVANESHAELATANIRTGNC